MWKTSKKFREIVRYCLICNKQLKLSNNRDVIRKKYCSNRCRKKAMRSPEWRLKISKTLTGKPHPHKGNPGHLISEETRIKISNALKGKNTGANNNNWKGGVTPEHINIRNSVEYKQWRLGVFERDGFRCVGCGDNRGGNLEAHHILSFAEYPELRLENSNGVTLCEKCHKQLHKGKINVLAG